VITIEIHGARADGTPYRLNAFNEEKVALGSPGADEKGWRKRYEAFLRRAERDALVWRAMFPDDTIRVVEIDLERDALRRPRGARAAARWRAETEACVTSLMQTY
jgi:hypothetical protein